MKIAIGADHAGFALKEYLREKLAKEGHQVDDLGAYSDASVDYPDYASAVAHQVASGAADRGVLVCYTGVGMSIAANKVDGIRAALAVNPDEIALTRRHNNANVVTFGAKFTPPEDAARMLDVFLTTDFTGGRHARRVDKIMSLEREKHD